MNWFCSWHPAIMPCNRANKSLKMWINGSCQRSLIVTDAVFSLGSSSRYCSLLEQSQPTRSLFRYTDAAFNRQFCLSLAWHWNVSRVDLLGAVGRVEAEACRERLMQPRPRGEPAAFCCDNKEIKTVSGPRAHTGGDIRSMHFIQLSINCAYLPVLLSQVHHLIDWIDWIVYLNFGFVV